MRFGKALQLQLASGGVKKPHQFRPGIVALARNSSVPEVTRGKDIQLARRVRVSVCCFDTAELNQTINGPFQGFSELITEISITVMNFPLGNCSRLELNKKIPL